MVQTDKNQNWNYEYNAIIYFNKFPMRYTAIAATCFDVVAAVAATSGKGGDG